MDNISSMLSVPNVFINQIRVDGETDPKDIFMIAESYHLTLLNVFWFIINVF